MENYNSELSNHSKEELLELLDSYQKAIDVNTICSVADHRGIITYVNDKFCEVSQYRRDELIGKTHRVINSYYHPAEFFEQMWLTIRSGKVWHAEIKNKAKDGSYYWVDTVIYPVTGPNGEIRKYLSFRMLITEKKKAEDALLEYNQKLKDILYMTSNRLRGPITTCQGLLNMMHAEQVNSPDELKRIIAHMKTSAQQMSAFSNELTEMLLTMEKRYSSSK